MHLHRVVVASILTIIVPAALASDAVPTKESGDGTTELFGPGWVEVDNQPCQVNLGSSAVTTRATWSGGCVDGKAEGYGELIMHDGRGALPYTGSMRAGFSYGEGTLLWFNGDRYEGAWRYNRRHGHGIKTFANGDRVEGEWRNDLVHGRATKTFANGRRFQGDWRDDENHGQGTFTLADGTRYEGAFRHDRFDGRGVMTWPDGQHYEGEFRDDQRHGEGVMTYADGRRYEGEWSEGNRHGQGAMAWPDGRRYQGGWRDGERHGQGAMTWPDSRRYQGAWRNDRVHGHGVYIEVDGTRVEGQWIQSLLETAGGEDARKSNPSSHDTAFFEKLLAGRVHVYRDAKGGDEAMARYHGHDGRTVICSLHYGSYKPRGYEWRVLDDPRHRAFFVRLVANEARVENQHPLFYDGESGRFHLEWFTPTWGRWVLAHDGWVQESWPRALADACPSIVAELPEDLPINERQTEKHLYRMKDQDPDAVIRRFPGWESGDPAAKGLGIRAG